MNPPACETCLSDYLTVSCESGACKVNRKRNMLRRYEASGTEPACKTCLSPFLTVGCEMGKCSFEKKINLNAYPGYNPDQPLQNRERFGDGKNFSYHRTPRQPEYKGFVIENESNSRYFD